MKKQQFNFEEIFSFAWSKTKQHAWFLVCTVIIYGIILSAVRMAPVLEQVTIFMVAISMLSISLLIVRNESFSFADLFTKLRSPKLVLTFTALTLIYMLAVSVFIIPFIAGIIVTISKFLVYGSYILTKRLLLVLFGTMLLALPGIYIAVRFKFFPYVLLENENMSVLEVINETSRLTCCKFWSLLWFFIILFVMNFLGFLLLGFGLIITVPISVFAVAHLYRNLEGHIH